MSASSSSSQGAVVAAPPQRLLRLLHDVHAVQVPSLKRASSLGPRSEGAPSLDDVESELTATLLDVDRALEAFKLEAFDLGDTESERREWAEAVTRASQDVSRARREANLAMVQARKAQRANAGRGDLFGDMASSAEERRRRREAAAADDRGADDKLMTASSDVTSALQRTVALMSAELEKSSYSSQLLDESSTTLQAATAQYQSFSDLVASSRQLIKSMERADLYDAALLLLSFAFFCACILYILKVRIWDRGVGILGFFFRIGGMATRTRSMGDVKEKLELAKQASAAAAAAAATSSSASSASAWSKSAMEAAKEAAKTAVTTAIAASASSSIAEPAAQPDDAAPAAATPDVHHIEL
ncbi:Sec20-domain-containing protein [Acaromyces ingoldii]|uniref:Sec20-domain-containing protein n=1 Tax=Acaromyces ingoldii TaxID=215250 RepID=A0A316YIG2_9BASI|nr:Sec20-domain-containing protein [Acaromyces ingoldii]PWN89330.1 Sec20-domain-containing protein [Acaromyces ingoldii]